MRATFIAARSTRPMPSALRSPGGSFDSSTPGPAIGEPDNATRRRRPSLSRRIPRGRLPTARMPTTVPATGSTIATRPPGSSETYTRGPAGAGCADCVGGDSDDRPPQPVAASAVRRRSDNERDMRVILPRRGGGHGRAAVGHAGPQLIDRRAEAHVVVLDRRRDARRRGREGAQDLLDWRVAFTEMLTGPAVSQAILQQHVRDAGVVRP